MLDLCLVILGLFRGRALVQVFDGNGVWPLEVIVTLGAFLFLAVIVFILGVRQQRQIISSSTERCYRSLLILVEIGFFVGISELIMQSSVERIHLLKYSALSFLLFFSQAPGASLSPLWRAFLLSSLIGVTEESAQIFIPERVFDLRDILLNSWAALNGLILAALFVLPLPQRPVSVTD